MRRPILLLLSLALLLGLGGCMPYVRQTPEEETTLITVGFSQVGAESDWRVANTESMRESLSEENGFELLFDNARQKQENQFKAIRTFIQQDVDYIVLAPVTETGWESVLEEARAAGIPVIIVDRQVEVDDPSLYTSWVGSNFRKTADEAVAWLSEKLKADGREEAVIEKINTLVGEKQAQGLKVGVIASDETKDAYSADYVVSIGARDDEDAIARHLYRILREFDDWNVDAIYSESFETPRIGQAIMNRLLKAAGHQVIYV